MAASTSTNSEDFHVGVLRIVNTPTPENWYVSGVYIESGPITTAIGSGSSSPAPPGSSSVTPTTPPTSTAPVSTPVSTTTSASGPAQSQWGQCGGTSTLLNFAWPAFTSFASPTVGTGYTGPTTCASPYTCKAVSPPYYYQVGIHAL